MGTLIKGCLWCTKWHWLLVDDHFPLCCKWFWFVVHRQLPMFIQSLVQGPYTFTAVVKCCSVIMWCQNHIIHHFSLPLLGHHLFRMDRSLKELNVLRSKCLSDCLTTFQSNPMCMIHHIKPTKTHKRYRIMPWDPASRRLWWQAFSPIFELDHSEHFHL